MQKAKLELRLVRLVVLIMTCYGKGAVADTLNAGSGHMHRNSR